MSENVIRLDFQVLIYRVLIYREDDFYIAHCLETDLVAEGGSATEAIENLVDISNVQIEAAVSEGDIKSLFSLAPPELWQMYAISADASSADAISRMPRRINRSVNRLNIRKLAAAG